MTFCHAKNTVRFLVGIVAHIRPLVETVICLVSKFSHSGRHSRRILVLHEMSPFGWNKR